MVAGHLRIENIEWEIHSVNLHADSVVVIGMGVEESVDSRNREDGYTKYEKFMDVIRQLKMKMTA